MRCSAISLGLLGTILISSMGFSADRVPVPEGLNVAEAYSALSADEIKSKLVVMLITDDDPIAWAEKMKAAPDAGKLGGGVDVWCGNMVRRSFAELFKQRPDLRDLCLLQMQPAGLPVALRSRASPILPHRVITAICDGSYRLLAFAVGVPAPDEFIHMIEDAEETKLLLKYHRDDVAVVRDEIALRSRPRLRRIYHETFDQTLERIEPDKDLNVVSPAWGTQLAHISNDFKPSYFQDVRLRFGFDDPNDLVRLIVLEQHCETRNNWCQAVSPFVLGRPIKNITRSLLDTTWGMPPVIDVDIDDHKEILNWYSSQRENDSLILSIKTTLLDLDQPWPPHDISGAKRNNRGWNALETAMSHHEYRNVTIESLAVLLHTNDLNPIDPFFPRRLRYVIFEKGKRNPTYVREGDVPGKFLARLE